MISQLTKPHKFPKQIKDLEKKISEAQDKVENQLSGQKFPIWELNPIISDLFANVEYYQDESRQQYIREWISEQERIDQIFDVFKNAIPIALSIACFFMPGGVSVALLILQGMNAAIGAVAAIDDINDAARKRDMAYSQFVSSDEANRMVDEADLNGIERNYVMAIVSGIFSIGDILNVLR